MGQWKLYNKRTASAKSNFQRAAGLNWAALRWHSVIIGHIPELSAICLPGNARTKYWHQRLAGSEGG